MLLRRSRRRVDSRENKKKKKEKIIEALFILAEDTLNLGRVGLNSHFLLRTISRESGAVGRETGIVNTERFWLLEGATKWRCCARHASGSRHRRHRAVSGSADVRLATGVCHRDGATWNSNIYNNIICLWIIFFFCVIFPLSFIYLIQH